MKDPINHFDTFQNGSTNLQKKKEKKKKKKKEKKNKHYHSLYYSLKFEIFAKKAKQKRNCGMMSFYGYI